MTKGLPLFSFLDKRKLVEAPLTKGAMLNNKGKKQGTGTTTEARKEKIRKKGMERENKNMRLEDVNIDWAKAAADKTYGKPHLLTKQELHDYLWPKEAEEKRKEKEKLEQDCKKLKKTAKQQRMAKGQALQPTLTKGRLVLTPRMPKPKLSQYLLTKEIQNQMGLQSKQWKK